MGYYALGGRETDRRLFQLIKTYIETDVNRRREYVKNVATGSYKYFLSLPVFTLNETKFYFLPVEKAMSQLPHILSDYMLVFAVPVLTHDPNFTNHEDPIQLKQLEKCLWLILEPLISNKEFFCFGFYKNLIDRMKHHKDSYKSDDDATNCVSNCRAMDRYSISTNFVVQRIRFSNIVTSFDLFYFLLVSYRKCGQYVTLPCMSFTPSRPTMTPEISHWTLEYQICISRHSQIRLKTISSMCRLICSQQQRPVKKWALYYQ